MRYAPSVRVCTVFRYSFDVTLERAHGAGRYAPSPSGDLHLGNLRTALIAWLAARASGREFVLRIEDLDRDRDQGAAPTQLEHLRALGLTWDGDPLIQTQRIPAYRDIVAALDEQGFTYECVCTRKDILEAPRAPHDPPGSYPGTCRDLTPEHLAEAKRAMGKRHPAIRIRLPEQLKRVTFQDGLTGQTVGDVDDFVLVRGDGTYAYNLVVVVDDAHQGVDQVVRGDDLLLSTPRHLALQQILGYSHPSYWHVPLVLGPTGKRLAKRDGAVTLPELRAQGMSGGEVLAMLGASLGLCAPDERVSAEQLIDRFNWGRIPSSPWVWTPSVR